MWLRGSVLEMGLIVSEVILELYCIVFIHFYGASHSMSLS